jgi:hypothetical protein
LQGGVVRILNDLRGASSEAEDVQEAVARIRHTLLEGHTVVFRGDGLRAAGVTIDQLVAGIDEQLGVDPDAGSRLADGDASSGSKVAGDEDVRTITGPGITIEVHRGGTAAEKPSGRSTIIRSGQQSDDTFRPYVRTRSKPGTK